MGKIRRFALTPSHLAAAFVISAQILVACHSSPVKTTSAPEISNPTGAGPVKSGAVSVATNVAPPPQIQVYQPSSNGTEKAAPGVPDGAVFAKQITTMGDNFAASFSPDGTKILFESRGRVAHKQSQVYELRLATMTERRVTFQDGDVTGATYAPDGEHIVYASTTDEIKEEDVYMQSIFKSYLPEASPKSKASPSQTQGEFANLSNSDIYRESLDGRELERLTVSRGYDGEPSSDAKGQRVIFTSDRFGVANLFVYNSKGLSRLTESDVPDRYGRFSPDLKSVVWTRFSKDYKSARLTLAEGSAKKPIALTSAGFVDIHPAWSPDGRDVVFSSNRGGKNFDLYVTDRLGKCLKRLTDVAGDELYPAFNSDGTKLIFTGNQSGTNQIYLMDYHPPTGCLPSP